MIPSALCCIRDKFFLNLKVPSLMCVIDIFDMMVLIYALFRQNFLLLQKRRKQETGADF